MFLAIDVKISDPEFHKNCALKLVGGEPSEAPNLAGGDAVEERRVALEDKNFANRNLEQQLRSQLEEWKIKCLDLEQQVLKLKVKKTPNQ